MNNYISNRIQQLAKAKQKKYSDLASALNVTESFIQKVHTHQRHYNTSHLYILARLLQCSVGDFYPTDYNAFKRLYPYSEVKESDFHTVLQDMEDQIKYDKKEDVK